MGKTKGFLENRLSFSISLDEDFELSKTTNNPRILLRRRLYTPPFRGMCKKPHLPGMIEHFMHETASRRSRQLILPAETFAHDAGRLISDPSSNAPPVLKIGLAEFLLQIAFFPINHAISHDQNRRRKKQYRPERIHEKGDPDIEKRQGKIQRNARELKRSVGNQRRRRFIRVDIRSGAAHCAKAGDCQEGSCDDEPQTRGRGPSMGQQPERVDRMKKEADAQRCDIDQRRRGDDSGGVLFLLLGFLQKVILCKPPRRSVRIVKSMLGWS